MKERLRPLTRVDLAGSQFAKELLQPLIAGLATILLHGHEQGFLTAQHLDDLLVGADTERPQKNRQVKLPLAVDAHPENTLGIRFKLDPGAPVGDDLGCIEFHLTLIADNVKIGAR